MSHHRRQSTNHIWMTEPVRFHCNVQTMPTNTYQSPDNQSIEDIQSRAVSEFRTLRDRLNAAGITVTTTLGEADSPDDIFPNWASTHILDNGERVVVYYPMLNENRRLERRDFMKDLLERTYHVELDLTHHESHNRALEGTSVLWMDRLNMVAYCSLSARTDTELAQQWCGHMGYDFVPFETKNHADKPVYHTDVMMSIGTKFAVICYECILPDYRDHVRAILSKSGREIIEIDMRQLRAFCGNILELVSKDGEFKLVMSQSAYDAYSPDQIAIFRKYVTEIITAPLTTIQTYGGGAARCMIMELF